MIAVHSKTVFGDKGRFMTAAVFVALTSSMTGCVNMSGISGASDSFNCKAPEGVTCTSVSGVYANAIQNNLPGQPSSPVKAADLAPDQSTHRATVSSGEAIRTQPRELRVWIAPWEDSDADLHDQAFIFMAVDSGRWVIEHNRARIRQEFAPSLPQPSLSHKGRPSTSSKAEVPPIEVPPIQAVPATPFPVPQQPQTNPDAGTAQPGGEAHAE